MNKRKNQYNFVFPDPELRERLEDMSNETRVPMAELIRIGIALILKYYSENLSLPKVEK